MTDVRFSSEMTVKLIRAMASDDFVIQAAQVSAKGENNPGTVPQRLIDALIAGKHGSPFEHGQMTFFVKVPLFIRSEWMRHRMSSFNEWSGRYSEMLPEFYVPAEDRAMINKGTKMKPDMQPALPGLFSAVTSSIEHVALEAWENYANMLDLGVANEVARMCLPVNTYTQFYWTVNPRSLMNFLSLRVQSDDSTVKSYPQIEIQWAADEVERHFAELMPATYDAFIRNGRMAP